MIENKNRSVFDIINRAKLRPIDRQLLHLDLARSDEDVEVINQYGLPLPARDLLQLSNEDIFRLSIKIKRLFFKLAAKSGVKMSRDELVLFSEDKENSLFHEIYHLRKIQEFRPEIIEDASINILAVKDEGELRVVMNVMTAVPESPYTAIEFTQIRMAPPNPSNKDYHDIYVFIRDANVEKSEWLEIVDVVVVKPESFGRAQIISFIVNMLRIKQSRKI